MEIALLLAKLHLAEWDGKIWRLLVFEIELLWRRIVPNIWRGIRMNCREVEDLWVENGDYEEKLSGFVCLHGEYLSFAGSGVHFQAVCGARGLE